MCKPLYSETISRELLYSIYYGSNLSFLGQQVGYLCLAGFCVLVAQWRTNQFDDIKGRVIFDADLLG